MYIVNHALILQIMPSGTKSPTAVVKIQKQSLKPKPSELDAFRAINITTHYTCFWNDLQHVH